MHSRNAESDTANRQPSTVFAIGKRGEKRVFWTAIGAAGADQDGDGVTVNLNLVPGNGEDTVSGKGEPAGDQTVKVPKRHPALKRLASRRPFGGAFLSTISMHDRARLCEGCDSRS